MDLLHINLLLLNSYLQFVRANLQHHVRVQYFQVLHLDLLLSCHQVLERPVVHRGLRFHFDRNSVLALVLHLNFNFFGNVVCLSWVNLCLVLLVELFTVLLVLLTMLSLPATIGMTNLDSLQLILYGTDLVLYAKIFHLDLVDPNDVLYL